MPLILTMDVDELRWWNLFEWCGKVRRHDYKKQWVGDEYRFRIGKYRQCLVSHCNDQKYLLWCLNTFEHEAPLGLTRALIDQFNAQFD